MEYLIAILVLIALPVAFMRAYGRRVATFKGPWIFEEQRPPRSSGLVYESVDDDRRLVGLTPHETHEFEQLDQLSPVDTSGQAITWHSAAAPASTRETRWLELYLKHQDAQKGAPRGDVAIEMPRRAAAGNR